MVGKEDLIYAHFDRPHLEESDDEYDYEYDSNESIDTPMVETVADKHTDKFVFNNVEELFPSPHNEPMFHPTMHPANSMLETTEAEHDTYIKNHLQHDDQVTPEEENQTLSLDFLLGKVYNQFLCCRIHRMILDGIASNIG